MLSRGLNETNNINKSASRIDVNLIIVYCPSTTKLLLKLGEVVALFLAM